MCFFLLFLQIRYTLKKYIFTYSFIVASFAVGQAHCAGRLVSLFLFMFDGGSGIQITHLTFLFHIIKCKNTVRDA